MQWYNIADHRSAFQLQVMRGLQNAFAQGRVRFLSQAVGYLLRRKEQESEDGVRDAIQDLADGVTRVALMVSPQYAITDIRKGAVVERVIRLAVDAVEADSRETYGSDVEFGDMFGGDPIRLAAACLMLNLVAWHRMDDEYVYITSGELLDEAIEEQKGGPK